MSDYTRAECQNCADEFVRHFDEQIIEMLVNDGRASTDLCNDYDDGDAFIHEMYVDNPLDPDEAMEILNRWQEYEETDSGLWAGKEWDQILEIKAAHTWGAAVCAYIQKLIRDINTQFEAVTADDDGWTNPAGDYAVGFDDLDIEAQHRIARQIIREYL